MAYLILALLLFTALNLIATVAARNANTNLVALISGIGGLIIPLLVVLPGLTKQTFQNQKFGLWLAMLTGVLVGAYALTLNKSFTENKIAIITPVIFGGTIFLMTILSFFLFKEKISVLEGIGLACVLLGIIIIIIYARAVTV